LNLVAVQTLGKPLQPIEQSVAFHQPPLHAADFSGLRQKRGGQRQQRLAKGLFISLFGFAVDDRGRKKVGKRAAHQTPLLVGTAHLAGRNRKHEFHQGTVGVGMRPGEMLERFGCLQAVPIQYLAEHAKTAPPAGHGFLPLPAAGSLLARGRKKRAHAGGQRIQLGKPSRSGERIDQGRSRPGKPDRSRRPPQDRENRSIDCLAPGKCLAECRSHAALLEIVGHLLAVVSQVAHDEVAELAREQDAGAQVLHAPREYLEPGYPPRGIRAAGFACRHQGHIPQVEMDSREAADALHFANVPFVPASRMQVAEGDGFRGRRQKPVAHAHDG